MRGTENRPDRPIRRADLILIAALLVLALLLALGLRLFGSAGAVAVVSVDGVETARYPLSADGTYPLNGGTNTLVIENGTARVTEADCPDRLCVRQGAVRYTGQSIVCLPNRLVVTIEGAEKSPVDAVT